MEVPTTAFTSPLLLACATGQETTRLFTGVAVSTWVSGLPQLLESIDTMTPPAFTVCVNTGDVLGSK